MIGIFPPNWFCFDIPLVVEVVFHFSHETDAAVRRRNQIWLHVGMAEDEAGGASAPSSV